MKTLFNVFSAVSPNEKNLKKLWKSNVNSDWKTNVQRIRCCALLLYPLERLSRKGAKAKKTGILQKSLQKIRLIELFTMFSVITPTKKIERAVQIIRKQQLETKKFHEVKMLRLG